MISVIIPIYNAEKYLERMLKCVEEQSFKDFEVLLINDGSKDNSENICDMFAQKNSRFIHVKKENAGVSAARNNGIKLSKGEYITFLDADDEIPQNYLEVLYNTLVDNNADMSVCDVVNIDNGKELNRFTCENKILTQTETLNLLLSRRNINSGPCAKLFKREVTFNLNFPKLKAYEDILFVKDYILKCKKIAVTDETAYYYDHHDESAMGTFSKMPSLDIINATSQILDFLKIRKDLDSYCFYITISHLMQYVQMLAGNEEKQAKSFIKESKALMKKNLAGILKCSAFPWKEKIVYSMFIFGLRK